MVTDQNLAEELWGWTYEEDSEADLKDLNIVFPVHQLASQAASQGATSVDMKCHFGWVQKVTSVKYVDQVIGSVAERENVLSENVVQQVMPVRKEV